MALKSDPEDIYRSIGVKPIINATGTMTMYSGSKLRPESVEAMQKAAGFMIDIDELIKEADISLLKFDYTESKARKNRLSMYEKEADKQKEILLLNEKVISEMESMIFKMNTLKSQDKESTESMDQSIEELQLWAERTKLYDQ